MADPIHLNAQQIAGTTYDRYSEIVISNPLNGTPTAQCRCDTLLVLPDGTSQVIATRNEWLTYDPAASLPIIDPTTATVVSQMPMPQVFMP